MQRSDILEISRRIFSHLTVLFLLCQMVEAQEVIHVSGQQGCQLLEIRNVKEMQVEPGTLMADFGSLRLEIPFDSITFVDANHKGVRWGWWGDIDDDWSACYYCPDSTNVPDVKLSSSNGTCNTVIGYVRNSPNRNLLPRKVGGKWRYTIGTLTGRHRFRVSCYNPTCFEHYSIFEGEDYADYMDVDMSVMFEGKPSLTVAKVLDYWYLPSNTQEKPERPVFGDFDGWQYEVPLVDDSLTVVVGLTPGCQDDIVGDTLKLVFGNSFDAQRTYSEMETTNEADLKVFLYDNTIYIIEEFEATAIDEVMRWLVMFDMNLYKPLFLRDDE